MMCNNTDKAVITRTEAGLEVKGWGGYDGYAVREFTSPEAMLNYLLWLWGVIDYDTYKEIENGLDE